MRNLALLGDIGRPIKYLYNFLDTLVSKACAENKQLFVAFIDFKKAYDFVLRDGLFLNC